MLSTEDISDYTPRIMLFQQDSRTGSESRSIGGGRDQSALTDGRVVLLNAIIDPYKCLDYFVHHKCFWRDNGYPFP